jgi:hypothetical protein
MNKLPGQGLLWWNVLGFSLVVNLVVFVDKVQHVLHVGCLQYTRSPLVLYIHIHLPFFGFFLPFCGVGCGSKAPRLVSSLSAA